MAKKKAASKKAKKSKKEKGQEWKHDHVSGSSHPDHKPPLQIVAEASDEAAEKETQALDSAREKENTPDWAALPGGKPADPSKPAALQKPGAKRPEGASATGKAVVTQPPATVPGGGAATDTASNTAKAK